MRYNASLKFIMTQDKNQESDQGLLTMTVLFYIDCSIFQPLDGAAKIRKKMLLNSDLPVKSHDDD